MRSKPTPYFLIISFLFQCYAVPRPHAEAVEIGPGGAGQEFFLAVSLPPKERLTLVSIAPLRFQGKLLGAIAVFDDIATARPGDYLELYNDAGALLAVSWFDRFGIERLAVDRALVEHADNLKGVYVLLITGDSI